MQLPPVTILLLGSALLTAGCARGGGDYPSLGIRDAERVQGSFAPAQPTETAPPPLDPVVAASLPQLASAARAAHGRFLAALPTARAQAARGRGVDVTSDAWAAAQIALADLESLRSQTAVALGDADLLLADAMLADRDTATLTATRAEIAELVDEEDRALAELRPSAAN